MPAFQHHGSSLEIRMIDDDPFADVNAELAGMSTRTTRPRVRTGKRDAVGWLVDDLGDAPEGIARETLDAETLAKLRLTLVSGVGPRTMASLLAHFGTAANVLAASSEALSRVDGVGPKTVNEIKLGSRRDEVDSIVHWCRMHDTEMLVLGSDRYPAMLADLEDAPPILFCRGELLPQDEMAVAIVGTRHATPYGIKQTERLSHSLARAGVTVVSGLARGIDASAHEGALSGGGRTIAVLGGGLGQMYPPEHDGLAKAIVADGAVISEQPPMMKARSSMFPQRNRIVAGLAIATLVIEAPQRSGSLITARLAGEMNRDVLALPGSVDSRVSRGCHELIRDGATLVQNVDDILEVLGPMRNGVKTADGTTVHRPAEVSLNEIEKSVLSPIGVDATAIDAVIAQSGLPAHRVMSVISILEMKRLIRRVSGQYVCRA